MEGKKEEKSERKESGDGRRKKNFRERERERRKKTGIKILREGRE
jgi:hypothetical protein